MEHQQQKFQKKKPGLLSTHDGFMGKVPPQNIEMEKAVLGAIMLEREAFDNASEIVNHECFYTDAHQVIFKCMGALAAKNMPIDMMTVCSELISMGQIEKVGGPLYVSQLTNVVTSGAHIKTHARKIFEHFLKREIIRVGIEMTNIGYDDTEDAFECLDNSEKAVNAIGLKNIKGGMIHIEKVMMDAVVKIEYWMKNDDSITGIPSGFPELDKASRGWQPGDLIVVAARPSVGKTAFALNLARNAAENKRKKTTVAIWSLEMKAVYLALRMLSAESKNILYRLQTGKISPDEMKAMMKNAVQTLSALNIFFDENTNITLQTLSRKARRLKKTEGLGLIIIDYMQLMSGEEKSGNREQEISKISRGLKNLAQELDIPIIALSQLSREMGAKNVSWDYGPPIASIRESGAIEQDADVICMLWGPSDEDLKRDPSLEGKRKVRLAKQRNGVLITEELDFKNEIQLFQAIDGITESGGNWKSLDKGIISHGTITNFYETEKPEDDMPF